MPEFAESGKIRHPPPCRAHQGAGRGTAAAAIGLLIPLLLPSGILAIRACYTESAIINKVTIGVTRELARSIHIRLAIDHQKTLRVWNGGACR